MTLLPRRLNLRVILLVSAILCVTGVLSGWVTAKRQSDRLIASMCEHAAVVVRNLADNSARYMVLQDYADLESFLLMSAQLPDIGRLQLCEPDGRVIADISRSDGGQALSHPGIARIETPTPPIPSVTVQQGELVVWQPIKAGSMLGWIRAEYSMASIRQAQAETWIQSAALALFWIVGSAGMIFLVLRPTALALKRLTVFARELDACKGARVAVDHGSVEIYELEESLNYASEKLFSTEQQLMGDKERLRESEAMYRSLVTAMAEGVVFQSADGVITAVNPAAERIEGRSADQMLGRTSDDPQLGAVYEDGTPFPGGLHPSMVTLRTGEPKSNVVMGIHRPDGTLVWISVNTQPLVPEHGKSPSAVVTTFHDITEQKRGEEALLHLAAIVEFSDDAIIGKSPQGIILSWNRGAEHLYGYRKEEVIGHSIAMLLPEESTEELSYIMDHVQKGIPVEHYETVRRRKDGSRIDLSVTISPIFDNRGRSIGASTIARDITERKLAEERLLKLNEELELRVDERTAALNNRSLELAESQRALMNIVEDLSQKSEELEQANRKLQELDRLKSLFIASMSHELRTPLNSIIGFSSVILNEWLGPVNAEQKENLAIILRSGKHLLTLINDVIDVSKIEAGKIESVPEEFELRDLVEEAMNLVKQDAQEKGLDLRAAVTPQRVYTDRRRLLQCLLNLLSNAVKFTQEGCVTVETRVVQDQGEPQAAGVAQIAVTDTGIGIREQDLPRMFQPFVRLVPVGKAIAPGTGLGLYLTRKLAAEILKGEILMTSEYGKGSRFTLQIPVRLL
jgi:PAS domain S-box-containing protein